MKHIHGIRHGIKGKLRILKMTATAIPGDKIQNVKINIHCIAGLQQLELKSQHFIPHTFKFFANLLRKQ